VSFVCSLISVFSVFSLILSAGHHGGLGEKGHRPGGFRGDG